MSKADGWKANTEFVATCLRNGTIKHDKRRGWVKGIWAIEKDGHTTHIPTGYCIPHSDLPNLGLIKELLDTVSAKGDWSKLTNKGKKLRNKFLWFYERERDNIARREGLGELAPLTVMHAIC